MPTKSSYDYAIVRLAPHVEREEFVNVGVILFCREQGYLGVRTCLDSNRARALAPDLDVDAALVELDLFQRVGNGDPTAGPIAALAQAERFHWLVAPRSTVIQVSPVHSGICQEPAQVLDRIFEKFACGAEPGGNKDTGPIRCLALGDSYTIGEAVNPADRWPAQLAAGLVSTGRGVAEPVIIAKTGWTTDELLAALAAEALHGPFDLVTLLIGVNNQYRGFSIETYSAEFAMLLSQAIALAGGAARRVIVLSIPDWGVTPFAAGRDPAKIRTEIELFNAVNRSQAIQAGANYVNVTPISRQAAGNPALLAGDRLHPSAQMYELWTALVLPEALSVLQGR